MLITIAVLCVLLYQYYQKYILCATKEGFARAVKDRRPVRRNN
jgi:hypothetical protein